jgi:hypothetical protein
MKNQIKTGDFLVKIKGTGASGKLIGLFTDNKCHTAHFVWEAMDLYVYEMNRGVRDGKKVTGCIRTKFEETEYFKRPDIWVLRTPKLAYSIEEKERFANMARQIYAENPRYDYDTLGRHAWSILFDRYPLEKRKDFALICSEYTSTCINAARHYTTIEEQCVSPKYLYDLQGFLTYQNIKGTWILKK